MTELVEAGAVSHEAAAQSGFAYRFDWGPSGLRALGPAADVVVLVDVLCFGTAVSAALESGAMVLPCRWADHRAAELASRHGALVTGAPGGAGPSSSPADLLAVPSGSRLVVPSPNSAALVLAAREHARHVLVGCLRNATATARRARQLAGDGGVVALIAAGERWHGDTGPLRPAVEDALGAGAVLAAIDPAGSVSHPGCSPEAAAVRAAFVAARPRLFESLVGCASGRELVARGCQHDVAVAAAHDVTGVFAELRGDWVMRSTAT